MVHATRSESSVRAAERVMLEFAGHVAESMRRLGTEGPTLDHTTYLLLVRLGEAEHLRQNDLAASLRLDASTLSRKVAHLQERGLVDRQADDEDRRAQRVSLTDRGREVLAAEQDARRARMRAVIGTWSAQDRADLVSVLTRLNAAISDQLDRPARPCAEPSSTTRK